MQRIILPTIGSGGDLDPLRVDMPTYTIVRFILNGQAAVVDVPDEDAPDLSDLPAAVTVAPGVAASMVDSLTPIQLARWRRRIDARYQEHAGKWNPVKGM